MHVPIENILSMKDFLAKAPDLAGKMNDDSLYVITKDDNPVAAFVSIEHLLAMSRDGAGLQIDKPKASGFGSSMMDEKELPAPPKPPTLPPFSPSSTTSSGFGTSSTPTITTSMPPKPAPPPTTFGAGAGTPTSSIVPPPPPLPPLPPAPKLDEKSPLVTESEVTQVVSPQSPPPPPPLPPLPPKPFGEDLPKPPAPEGPKPFGSDAPKPGMAEAPKPPVPPVTSPFSNVPNSSINPALPSSLAGTSNPPMWPTTTKPEPKPADAADDDLDQGDDIL